MEEKISRKLFLLLVITLPCSLEILMTAMFSSIGFTPVVTSTYMLLLIVFILQHEFKLLRWAFMILLALRITYLKLQLISQIDLTSLRYFFENFSPGLSVFPLYLALGVIGAISVRYCKRRLINE